MRRFKLLPGIILAMLVAGCGSGRPKPDPVPVSAIDANYPTLEMYACGKAWHGLAICRAKPEATVELVIQGYFNGAIRIASPNCNIAESRNYTNSSKITVSIPPFQGNCLIVATMSPVFPNEKGSGITVSSIRGLFALRRDSLARQWVGRVGKLSFPAAGTFTIPVGPITTGQVNLNGCGIDYSAPVNVFNKQAVLKYQDFIKQGSWSNCIADGFLSSKDYQDLLINALLITYSNSFTPLPTPTFSIKNDKLTVIGDAAVSAIYVDDTYQIAASIEVPFDSSVAHTVRLLTAKGRTVIGFWNPAKKDFTWMQ